MALAHTDGRFSLGDSYLEYSREEEGVVEIYHTYVPASARNQGLASLLCDAAFDFAKQNCLRVRPTCTYVSQTYLARNPGRAALVALERQESLDSSAFDEGDRFDDFAADYESGTTAPRRGGGRGGQGGGIYSAKHIRAKSAQKG